MVAGIGDDGLGEHARYQIEVARTDPRLARGRGASAADFKIAMEEIERVRALAIGGAYELARALEREEASLGVTRDSPNLEPSVVAVLQAAWERSEMARAEIEREHPLLNAQALLSLNSELDALVEEFVPVLRRISISAFADQAIAAAGQQHPEALEALTPEIRELLKNAAVAQLEQAIPQIKRLRDSGARRYETVLAAVGLQTTADRPIPDDLDQALAEFGALRDVLMHRAGRVDARALAQAPTLRYGDGDLVRISRSDYRTYSAAIRCYAQDILLRPMRNWPEVKPEDLPDLTTWRGWCAINA